MGSFNNLNAKLVEWESRRQVGRSQPSQQQRSLLEGDEEDNLDQV